MNQTQAIQFMKLFFTVANLKDRIGAVLSEDQIKAVGTGVERMLGGFARAASTDDQYLRAILDMLAGCLREAAPAAKRDDSPDPLPVPSPKREEKRIELSAVFEALGGDRGVLTAAKMTAFDLLANALVKDVCGPAKRKGKIEFSEAVRRLAETLQCPPIHSRMNVTLETIGPIIASLETVKVRIGAAGAENELAAAAQLTRALSHGCRYACAVKVTEQAIWELEQGVQTALAGMEATASGDRNRYRSELTLLLTFLADEIKEILLGARTEHMAELADRAD
jgi:hypothetical protein